MFVSEGFESAQFDSIDPSFSSERHTTSLMGSGLVELLAREMTADLQAIRAAAIAEAYATGKDAHADLVTKGVRFGSIVAHPDGIVDLDAIDGVDADLIVRPFSRKGVFTSLRQFTINALNIHHGMEAVERFGVRWTGSHDFAESGVPDAITAGDVSALVAFQATLPPPTVKADMPDDWRQAAKAGAETFNAIGCASCHMETLPLKSLVFTDPAPYDMAGTLRSGEVKAPIRIDLGALPFAKTLQKNDKGEWLIPLYSDLKRHLIVDETVNALRQRIAGAALRRARRVPDAATLGRRLDRALWPQRLLPHARRNHRGAWRRRAVRARRVSSARSREARRRHRFPPLARHRGAMMRIVFCIFALLAGIVGGARRRGAAKAARRCAAHA